MKSGHCIDIELQSILCIHSSTVWNYKIPYSPVFLDIRWAVQTFHPQSSDQFYFDSICVKSDCYDVHLCFPSIRHLHHCCSAVYSWIALDLRSTLGPFRTRPHTKTSHLMKVGLCKYMRKLLWTSGCCVPVLMVDFAANLVDISEPSLFIHVMDDLCGCSGYTSDV